MRNFELSDDQLLILDTVTGSAADTLYRRFAGRIYGLGLVMLGNEAAAQDLVQDTFVKLWRNADRYDRSRGKLETWVLLMARSLAIDAIRRRVLEAQFQEAGLLADERTRVLARIGELEGELEAARGRTVPDLVGPGTAVPGED